MGKQTPTTRVAHPFLKDIQKKDNLKKLKKTKTVVKNALPNKAEFVKSGAAIAARKQRGASPVKLSPVKAKASSASPTAYSPKSPKKTAAPIPAIASNKK